MRFHALGVLASGRGSNLQAILRARASRELSIPVAVVLSDNPDAPALELARAAGVEALHLPTGSFRTRLSDEAEAAWVAALRQRGVNLIALAGFMRVLHPSFLSAFPDAILNVHPSLLPAFPGLDAQAQALNWGVKWAGCTVHFVNEGVDAGPIVDQAVVPVKSDDTAESLSARILELEHRIFPAAIERVARGDFRVEGRRILPASANSPHVK